MREEAEGDHKGSQPLILFQGLEKNCGTASAVMIFWFI